MGAHYAAKRAVILNGLRLQLDNQFAGFSMDSEAAIIVDRLGSAQTEFPAIIEKLLSLF